MSIEATVLSQTTTENMLPVIPRNTASVANSPDFFVKLKDYILLWTGSSNPVMLLKKTTNGYKTVKALPPSGSFVPMGLGNNNAYVVKNTANCSITLYFIDVETDAVTSSQVTVSTATNGTVNNFAVDVINGVVYVAAIETASAFLYTGTVNFTNKTISFTKTLIFTVSGSTYTPNIPYFCMITASAFHFYGTTTLGPATYGLYTFSSGVINKTNAAFSGASLQNGGVVAVVHTASSVYAYMPGSTWMLYQIKAHQVTDASTASLTPVPSTAADSCTLYIDNISGESFIDLYTSEGNYYSIKEDACTRIATVGLPPHSPQCANSRGLCRLGPVVDGVLFVLDAYNQSIYYTVPAVYKDGAIVAATKRIKIYTNTTAKTQLITSVAVAVNGQHTGDGGYPLSIAMQPKNTMGLSLNDKPFFIDAFDYSVVHAFANCPIALKPNEYISLEVLNAFGDITTTINGIVDTTQA